MIGRYPDTGPLAPPPSVIRRAFGGSAPTHGASGDSGVPPFADDDVVLRSVRETNRRPGIVIDPGKPRYSTDNGTDATDQTTEPSYRWTDVKPEIRGGLMHMTRQEREAMYGTSDPVRIQEIILGSTPSALSEGLSPHVQDELVHMTIKERLERFGTSNLKEIEHMLLEDPHDDVDRQLSARLQMEVMRMTPSARLTHFGTTNLDVIRRILHHRMEVEHDRAKRLPGPERRIPLRWGAAGAPINEESPRPARPESDETPAEPEVINPLVARLEAIRSLHPQAEVLINRIQAGQPVSESMIQSLELIAEQVKSAQAEASASNPAESQVAAVQVERHNPAEAPSLALSETPYKDRPTSHPAQATKPGTGNRIDQLLRRISSGFSNPFRRPMPNSE